MSEKRQDDQLWTAWFLGFVIGVACGIPIGAAMGNVGVGIAIGSGIGIALAIAFGEAEKARRRKKR